MKTVVTVPVQSYNALLGRCLLASREYAILRNGVLSHGTGDASEVASVRILCEPEDAQRIFSLAARVYPAAVSYIAESIDHYQSFARGIDQGREHPAHNGSYFNETETDVFWREMFPSEHIVQIYDDDSVFMSSLELFAKDGVQSGDGVIVIATPAHLAALETRLHLCDLDLDAARAQHRYIPLEAEQCLNQFMVGRSPDNDLFRRVISEVVVRARGNGRRVRAFGEMVAGLWARGDQAAAMQLELLWQDLCQTESFALFCAYPRAGFAPTESDSIREICSAHSKVLPDLSMRGRA